MPDNSITIKKDKGLTSNAIKIIAIIAMTIDHHEMVFLYLLSCTFNNFRNYQNIYIAKRCRTGTN